MSDADDAIEREREFERIVLPLRPRMNRSVWRVVRDADLAEEALQDALEALWRKLHVLRSHPNPEAFVLRVCLDAAHDQLRARIRRRALSATLGEAVDSTETGEGRAWVGEVLAEVGRLARRQAVALLLHAVEGEPYESVARALGCSEATARVHVQRAREKLRRRFGRDVPRVSTEASS
ncbi:RNA polymerase sigma factor [Acidobacteria bacterium ACD]|nr:MAG: RNA polymerase sigma factor [Acidobacteriota bacterium]MDL1948981.1 RNA polymerase sigma factor [Acidobacteria bacterium ACD]